MKNQISKRNSKLKTKNRILYSISYLALVLFFFGLMSSAFLANDKIGIPCMIASMIWILPFAIINYFMEVEK